MDLPSSRPRFHRPARCIPTRHARPVRASMQETDLLKGAGFLFKGKGLMVVLQITTVQIDSVLSCHQEILFPAQRKLLVAIYKIV